MIQGPGEATPGRQRASCFLLVLHRDNVFLSLLRRGEQTRGEGRIGCEKMERKRWRGCCGREGGDCNLLVGRAGLRRIKRFLDFPMFERRTVRLTKSRKRQVKANGRILRRKALVTFLSFLFLSPSLPLSLFLP